jgi:hypothetical protein
MRKFRLRAALAASLLRDLFLGCALAASWPFRRAARGFDALARSLASAACDASPAADENVSAHYIDTRSL